VDETYVKVAGGWTYLYRAVDQHGQVIDVLVSTRRNAAAAQAFFARALRYGPTPVEVVTDRAPAYPRVIDQAAPTAGTSPSGTPTIPSKPTTVGSSTAATNARTPTSDLRTHDLPPGTHSCRTCAAGTTRSPPTYRCTIGSASPSPSSLYPSDSSATPDTTRTGTPAPNNATAPAKILTVCQHRRDSAVALLVREHTALRARSWSGRVGCQQQRPVPICASCWYVGRVGVTACGQIVAARTTVVDVGLGPSERGE
jgi:hypothetical protein